MRHGADRSSTRHLARAPAGLAAMLFIHACAQESVVARERLDAGASGDASRESDAALDAMITLDAATSPLFQDDFETCDYSRWTGTDEGAQRIDMSHSHSGRCSSESGHVSTLMSDRRADYPEASELWVSLWIRFGEEFRGGEPTSGIVLFTVADSDDDLHVTTLLSAGSHTIDVTNARPFGTVPEFEARSTFVVDAVGSRGRWHCVEEHVRLERAGESGGLVEIFVDGARVLGIDPPLRGESPRPLSRLRIQSRLLDTVWPALNFVQIDDVIVDRTRTGCAP